MRIAVFALVVLALQATAPPQTLTLQGTVVSSIKSAPIAGAQGVVAKVGGAVTDYRVAETDDTGRFVVRNLSAGRYRLFAERDGFLRGEFGRRMAAGNGVPVVLAEATQAPPVSITLIPTGTIT